MKKYSTSYFKEKFEILYNRLIEKEGFIEEIKKVRANLGIPTEGFQSTVEFADYLMERMTKREKEIATSLCFLEQYEMRNGRVDKEQMNKVMKDFDKKFKKNFIPLVIMISYQIRFEQHNDFYMKDKLLTYGKKNKTLYKEAKKIFDKYMGLDLLDAHVIMHFVEKYLYLGDKGVRDYIDKKVACSNCRYLGINHFSPARYNMTGQDKGPFSGEYLFNENTVKLLSSYFDSIFVIIKPYATKEQAIQYIQDNWNDLKEHIIEKNTYYKQFDVHPSRIKKSHTDTNKAVYELYKLSKKDLLKRYRGKENLSLAGIYKESIISRIIDEELGIKMSPDAVKKSATRFAQSIKIKREPKDIRDI